MLHGSVVHVQFFNSSVRFFIFYFLNDSNLQLVYDLWLKKQFSVSTLEKSEG